MWKMGVDGTLLGAVPVVRRIYNWTWGVKEGAAV